MAGIAIPVFSRLLNDDGARTSGLTLLQTGRFVNSNDSVAVPGGSPRDQDGETAEALGLFGQPLPDNMVPSGSVLHSVDSEKGDLAQEMAQVQLPFPSNIVPIEAGLLPPHISPPMAASGKVMGDGGKNEGGSGSGGEVGQGLSTGLGTSPQGRPEASASGSESGGEVGQDLSTGPSTSPQGRLEASASGGGGEGEQAPTSREMPPPISVGGGASPGGGFTFGGAGGSAFSYGSRASPVMRRRGSNWGGGPVLFNTRQGADTVATQLRRASVADYRRRGSKAGGMGDMSNPGTPQHTSAGMRRSTSTSSGMGGTGGGGRRMSRQHARMLKALGQSTSALSVGGTVRDLSHARQRHEAAGKIPSPHVMAHGTTFKKGQAAMDKASSAKPMGQSPRENEMAEAKGREAFMGNLVARTRRERIFSFFEDPTSSKGSFVWSVFILFMIVTSTVVFCVQSQTQYIQSDANIWVVLEIVFVSVFSFEYVIRLATCAHVSAFVRAPFNVIDLLAILPFYIELIILRGQLGSGSAGSAGAIRVVRLGRVLRLFKLSRYSRSFQMVSVALRRSSEAFGLLLFLILLAMIFFSSAIFYGELTGCRFDDAIDRWVYEEDFVPGILGMQTPFQSIPDTFWFTMVTVTNVGYGDETPVTGIGRFTATIAMLCGIVAVAFPISIIGSHFNEVWNENKRRRNPDYGLMGPHPNPLDVSLQDLFAHIRKNRSILLLALRTLESAIHELRKAYEVSQNSFGVAEQRVANMTDFLDEYFVSYPFSNGDDIL